MTSETGNCGMIRANVEGEARMVVTFREPRDQPPAGVRLLPASPDARAEDITAEGFTLVLAPGVKAWIGRYATEG